MNLNFFQNNFASGELSPEVWARVDRPFYKNGLEICKNFLPLLTGGCRFFPGTEFSIHTKLNRDAWTVPFRFNTDQAYSLEFTDYKIRIHHDGGVSLETAKAIEGISQADPGVVTITGHGFSTGDEVYFTGVGGMTALNKQFFLVVYINANTFSLTDVDGNAIDTTLADAWTSGGTVARVYEIASPYLASEGPKIKYCGTADLMYLFHPSREPRVLIRAGATSWSVAAYTRYSSELTITGITKANPGVITTAEVHGLIDNDRIYIAQVNGMVELNKTEYLVVYVGANTFSLKTLAGAAVDTSGFIAYVDGGKVAIVREAGMAITGITKAAAGVVTINAHGLETYDKVYISGIVGMTELNGLFFWVKKIDANTFSLTNELGVDVDTTGYTTWSSGGTVEPILGLFTKIGDFPGAGGFYGGRLNVGGTNNDPDTFWLSRGPDPDTGEAEYDDFSTGTVDTDGMVFILPAQTFQAHRIYWFSGTERFMIIGASSGVYKANGGQDGAAITPTAIDVNLVASIGVADMMPVVVGTQTYYIEQGGLTLRSFGYSLAQDSYQAFDKNIISDEITVGGIIQIVYAKGRPDIIFCLRTDGTVLPCVILESDDVAGWARRIIGGSGKVISMVTESKTIGFDRVGMVVERTINSATRRYIEYFSLDPAVPDISEFFTGEDNEAADTLRWTKSVFEEQKKFVRLDSALVLDTTQTTTLTLDALTGDGVTVTAGAEVFTADSVGQFIYAKFLTGDETGIAEIVEYTSATEVVVNIRQDFLSLTFASGGWYLTVSDVGGLNHAEGEELAILTDGAVHPSETVADGQVTLDYPARYIILGFPYTGIGRSLDFEVQGIPGTTQARNRTVEKVFLKLRNTMGGKFGVSLKGLYRITQPMYRKAGGSYYDMPPTLFSGLKPVALKDGYASEKKFYFVQDQPLPMEILAVIPSIDVGEEE